MAFRLGNHTIDEILFGLAQNFNDDILYVLDQLMSASIEVEAESNEITDKKGNVVRTVYRSKSGTFNSTNAFLHPAIMNAASGSEIEYATESAAIRMPKIVTVAAGGTVDVSDALEGTIHVIGTYANGANGVEIKQGASAEVDKTYGFADNKITVPAAGADAPTTYVIRYERNAKDGMKLSNVADKFPNAQRLTLMCSYMDPCDDTLKPCYVYFPSFMPDPSMTINLDSEDQELDFNGTIQLDYCATAGGKVLYVIYYPADETVSVTTESTEDEGN